MSVDDFLREHGQIRPGSTFSRPARSASRRSSSTRSSNSRSRISRAPSLSDNFSSLVNNDFNSRQYVIDSLIDQGYELLGRDPDQLTLSDLLLRLAIHLSADYVIESYL